MADVIVKVLEPAASRDLVSLEEMKTMLNIPAGDTSEDAQLQMLITNYSDTIAELTNREFAKEKVRETWRGDLPPYDAPRIFLTHYPVKEEDIESIVMGTEVVIPDYELEEQSGKINLFRSISEPIVITYTGGYLLPDEAPPALKQAMQLFVQSDRKQATQEIMSGVRMVAHRESRIMFHPPSKTESSGGGSGLTPTLNAVTALLRHYTRIWV